MCGLQRTVCMIACAFPWFCGWEMFVVLMSRQLSLLLEVLTKGLPDMNAYILSAGCLESLDRCRVFTATLI